MGVDKSTVSRWENEKEPIGPTADRLLRLMVLRQRPIDEYPTEHLAAVAQKDAPHRNIIAHTVGKQWTAVEEADEAA